MNNDEKELGATAFMGVLTPGGIAAFAIFMGLCLYFFTPSNRYGVSGLALAIPCFLLGIGFASFAHYRYQENREMYDRAYEVYPELTTNRSFIKEKSRYHNAELGLYLYNDLLISVKDSLRCYLLRDVVWFYSHILGINYLSVTPVPYTVNSPAEHSVMVGLVRHQRHFLKQLPLYHGCSNPQESLISLFQLVESNYPRNMLGYTPDTNQFFGVLREEDKGKPKKFWDFLF